MLEKSSIKASIHIQLPCGCFVNLEGMETCPHGEKAFLVDEV
ncbi:MAG: hypothetical protein ACFFB3_00500 [Candidatus Hodarchaeota archaeon]